MRHWLHPDVPFAPRRCPFFYGWVVVVASTIGVISSIPGQTMGVSAFTEDLLDELRIDRLAFSIAYFGGTGISGMILPWGGRLLDRWGTRRLIVAASLGLGIVLWGLSILKPVPLPGTAGTIATTAVLMIGILALRFSGQGMVTLASRTVLARWFEERRGTASAIAGIGIAAGFGIAPKGLDALVTTFEWRDAWRILGVVGGIGMACIGWLFFREVPEDCGLLPDGKRALREGDAGYGEEPPARPRDFTRAEALRTLAFWTVTLAVASQGLVITGVSLFIADIGMQSGLSRSVSFEFFIPLALIGTTVGFSAGRACDHVPIRYLVLTMMLAQIVGGIGMLWFGTQWGFACAAIGYGISGGFFGPLSTVALANYFGRTHLGAINGVMMGTLVMASAIGPLWLAIPEQLGHGYGLGLIAFLALPLSVAVLALFTRPPAPLDRAG